MRFQTKRSSCGPAAGANACEAIGLSRTEDEMAALMGTKPDGTDAKQMKKGLQATGIKLGLIVEKRVHPAMLAMYFCLDTGKPVVIPVEQWEHWVVVVGKLGTRYIVIDSAGDELVKIMDGDELAKWWSFNNGKTENFYGIVLEGVR